MVNVGDVAIEMTGQNAAVDGDIDEEQRATGAQKKGGYQQVATNEFDR